MLSTLTIRTRLILMLVLATALFLGARVESGLRTWWLLGEMADLYDKKVVPIEELKQISDAFVVDVLRVPENVRLGLMSPAEGSATLDAAMARLGLGYDEYATRIDSEAERQAAVELRDRIEAGRRLIPVLKGHLATGDMAALDRLAAADLHPRVAEIHREASRIIEINLDMAERSIADARTRIPRLVLVANRDDGSPPILCEVMRLAIAPDRTVRLGLRVLTRDPKKVELAQPANGVAVQAIHVPSEDASGQIDALLIA